MNPPKNGYDYELRWSSGESIRLPKCGLGLNPVEFVVGSLLGLKGFSLGSTGFPFPEKPTLPTSNLIRNARTHVEQAPERSQGVRG